MTNLQAEIVKLSATERLDLLDVLWESIESDAPLGEDPSPLTDEQSAELTRRIAKADSNPAECVPWQQVKENLFKKLEKR